MLRLSTLSSSTWEPLGQAWGTALCPLRCPKGNHSQEGTKGSELRACHLLRSFPYQMLVILEF